MHSRHQSPGNSTAGMTFLLNGAFMLLAGEERRERNLTLPDGAGSTFINDAQLAHALVLTLGIFSE